MKTPPQWAAKLLAEIAERPTTRREIASKCFRDAVNEALREAAYRLSEIRYCKPFSTEPGYPGERVLELLWPESDPREQSATENLFYEEPQFSADGRLAIYPREDGLYEIRYRAETASEDKVVMLDDEILIELSNLYTRVRANRRV